MTTTIIENKRCVSISALFTFANAGPPSWSRCHGWRSSAAASIGSASGVSTSANSCARPHQAHQYSHHVDTCDVHFPSCNHVSKTKTAARGRIMITNGPGQQGANEAQTMARWRRRQGSFAHGCGHGGLAGGPAVGVRRGCHAGPTVAALQRANSVAPVQPASYSRLQSTSREEREE